MVVKKPYAFLIRNFRIIHGVLFLFLLYLAKESLDIYDFYKEYVTMHAYNSSIDLISNYIGIGMFIGAIITIGVCAIIFYILSLKNKKRSLYLYIILTYIVYIGYIIFMMIGFGRLQGSSFNVETQRFYRDIAFMMLIPQAIAMVVIFLRAIGFNLRQFNFKKDLEEMNIEIEDSEEVELNIGKDSYKYDRAVRKFFRLTKYFILENKMFVIIVSSIGILIISLLVFNRINVYRNRVYEKEAIQANNVTYDIKESYITQIDMNNLIIDDNKYFILIKVFMQNKTKNDANLNRDTFRLLVKDKSLYPNLTISQKFIDMGNIFKSHILKSGLTEECFVIFEISKDQISSEYVLRISSEIANTNDNSGYKESIVTPSNLDKIIDNGTKTLPSSISFEGTFLKNSYLNINSYEIADKFKEKYTYELNGENKVGIYTVIPDKTASGDSIIMKIDSTIKIDKEAHISNYIEYPVDLYKYSGFLKYRALGKVYEVKLRAKETKYEKDNLSYLEVPSNIQDADKIELIILVRGQKYTFILK